MTSRLVPHSAHPGHHRQEGTPIADDRSPHTPTDTSSITTHGTAETSGDALSDDTTQRIPRAVIDNLDPHAGSAHGDDENLPVSVWTTAQTSPAAQRKNRYTPESTAHPAKMLPAVAAYAVPDPTDPERSAESHRELDWSDYAAAVRRWEQVLGRPAPFPTQPGRHGRPVLAPAFVEWLQGLEPGWVTGLGPPRTAELRALGNGVVPHQAAHAVALLLTDLAALLDDTTAERNRAGREANAA